MSDGKESPAPTAMVYREPPALAPSPPTAPARRPLGRSENIALFQVLPIGVMVLCVFVTVIAGLFSPMASWLAFAGVVGIFGWTLYRRARLLRGVRQLQEVQALITANHHEAAAEVSEKLLRTHRGYGLVEAHALTHLAMVDYRRGEAPQALATLEAIQRSGWCHPGSSLRPVVLQYRAMFHAVTGQVAEAEACLRELRSFLSAAHAEATLLSIDVLLAARTGRMADVAERTGTPAATPLLQNHSLRLLRAWALSSIAPEEKRDEVRILVDGAKPIAPGELRHMTRYWPELGAFLVANGLGEAT